MLTQCWVANEVHLQTQSENKSTPSVALLLGLGFSAGLPLTLVFQTLTAWLADLNIPRATISAFALISVVLGCKFLWAPLVDIIRIPVLGAHNVRVAWIGLGQLGISLGLLGMAASGPAMGSLWLLVWMTWFVCIFMSFQDIALDAWRVESYPASQQAEAIVAYQWGYRAAMLVASAGSLALAHWFSWALSYAVMAALQLGCLIFTLQAARAPKLVDPIELVIEHQSMAQRWGALAVAMRQLRARFPGAQILGVLLLLLMFRLGDSILGAMWLPYVLSLGFDKLTISWASQLLSLFPTLLGIAVAGFALQRHSLAAVLLFAIVLSIGGNALLPLISVWTNSLCLSLVTGIDGFGNGFASSALLGLIARLVQRGFTATQHAVFASLPFLAGRIFAAPTGWLVDRMGFEVFLLATTLFVFPLLALCWQLRRLFASLKNILISAQ
jgi:MFS transporter, PAT family, beta-lactamase induction signal transducer AmpG